MLGPGTRTLQCFRPTPPGHACVDTEEGRSLAGSAPLVPDRALPGGPGEHSGRQYVLTLSSFSLVLSWSSALFQSVVPVAWSDDLTCDGLAPGLFAL